MTGGRKGKLNGTTQDQAAGPQEHGPVRVFPSVALLAEKMGTKLWVEDGGGRVGKAGSVTCPVE